MSGSTEHGARTQEDFLSAYDPRAFDPVAVTVDIVALTLRQGALHVLLVRRGAQPYAGRWALPGGFLRPGRESLDQAARRELAEETGLSDAPGIDRVHLEQLGSYGAPARDPRMHVVSVAYLAFAPDLPDARAGGDAAAAAWVPVAGPPPDTTRDGATDAERRDGTHGGGPDRRSAAGARPPVEDLAFDHTAILADGLDRARAKIEYTPLATAFLGEEFTVTELRAVYETVWGRTLHAGNFHRKVLSVPGFVRPTGGTAAHANSRGGPRARLYRPGDARLLHPALLRPGREDGPPGPDAAGTPAR
ncbi:NUDIX domain-containing protein [Streptomyces sp. SL13]|uniref:NUDIX domain-containing protein n=1 Tax=Streptantibioticus silvisoli TaxID=2705255 RepID=A0AA90H6H5_9ACTN|nr:NUDIX hydrolase [Streptantibioticus silvisoli]MDI5967572.1 NUDIX domain-containing protein [Streptantibioticus silvisoli]MDI5972106.1 NUDIX domain-containing protein [Streptantibioticus silvisoli]